MTKQNSLKSKLRRVFALLIALILVQGVSTVVITAWVRDSAEEMAQAKESALELEEVISAKYDWVLDLTRAVYAERDFSKELNPDNCMLGKWLGRSLNDPAKQKYRGTIEELLVSHREVHEISEEMLELLNGSAADVAKAGQIYVDEVMPELELSLILMKEMQRQELLLSSQAEASMHQAVRLSRITALGMLIVTAAFALLMSERYIRSFIPPMERVTEMARSLSLGISVSDIEIKGDDEIGQLAKAFKEISNTIEEQKSVALDVSRGVLTCQLTPRSPQDEITNTINAMVDSLNQMMGEIIKVANEVSTGARHMSEGSQLTAQGATEQASTVQQLAATITSVSEQTTQNAKVASGVAELNHNIRVKAEEGMVQMEELVAAVKEIQYASSSIDKVIKIIDDIAYQTNILALNAAVEAARAGSHGKGFAVVADEVRNLAAKSAEAAKDTGRMLSSSIEKSELGASIADQTHESLEAIVEGILRTSEALQEIVTASREQEVSISEIHQGLDNVSNVVQQNSATAEESAASAEEMFGQAEALNQLISRFTVRRDIYEKAQQTNGFVHHTGISLTR